MRRDIPLALIAALVLAVGLSNAATADQGSADASAKSGKKGKRGKGKACKGNRGKGKSRGKARRSADASARSKKGGKGKARSCKGGGANWLEFGKYEGQGGVVSVEIRSRTRVSFGADTVCSTFIATTVEDAKLTANKLTAGRTFEPSQGGIPLRRMTLVVTPDYRYKLVVVSSGSSSVFPCKPGATTFEGKLKKVG